ncbi:ATP-binding cassette domain-containing protein [Paraburkholderia sp. SIMBA_049]
MSISGQRPCDISLNSLHDAIGVVPQDISLFNRSLLDNLRYGRPDATEAQVLQACEHAGCLDLIRSLPGGLQTIVGKRGTRLSGGQRQRVAIARAFPKDAPILLLDEATSSLDSASEAVIQAALERLMKGRRWSRSRIGCLRCRTSIALSSSSMGGSSAMGHRRNSRAGLAFTAMCCFVRSVGSLPCTPDAGLGSRRLRLDH